MKDSQDELERLKLAKKLPDDFKDIKETIHANAFGVLEALLNLIGQQLTYFATAAGILGSILAVNNHIY